MNFHLGEIDEGEVLTRGDLVRLYARCGRALHRGRLRDLMDPGEGEAAIETIRTHMRKMMRLLLDHTIRLVDGQTVLVVALATKQVQVAIAEARR